MDPSGAVVLIADGASAIGAATAAAFGAAGARVAIGGSRREPVAAGLGDFLIVDGDGALAERWPRMVRRTVEHFGTVDVLIVGTISDSAIRSDQLRAEDVRAAMEANLIGPMTASREALRVMRRQGRGHIITLTDPAYMLGAPLHAAHAASVAALSSWTRALQAELDETEIRVSEYFVGATSGVADESGDGFGAAATGEGRLARILGAVESPEEIALQLVACVRRPRATGYSSAAVRAAAAVGLFSRLRVRLGAGVARAWRARAGAAIFTPSADPVKRSGEDVVAPAPIEPEVAAGGEVERAVARAEPPAVAVPREAPRKVAAKKASRPRGAAKQAAVAKPAAGKSSAASPKKAARGKKVAPLSPEATARVRAAAERAAASARGKSRPVSPPAGEDEES